MNDSESLTLDGSTTIITKCSVQDECPTENNNNATAKQNGDCHQHPTIVHENHLYKNGNVIVDEDSEMVSEVEIVTEAERVLNVDSSKEEPYLSSETQEASPTSAPIQSNDLKLANNPKKYGKFRILVNSESTVNNSIEYHNNPSVNGVADDHSAEARGNDEETVSKNEEEETSLSKSKSRRGRPKKYESIDQESLELTRALMSESRRRSSRLRNIEEKKELPKPDVNTVDSNLVDSNSSNIDLCESKMSQLNFSKENCDLSEQKSNGVSESTTTTVAENQGKSTKVKSKKKSKHKSKSKSEKERSHRSSKKDKSKSSKTNKENNASHDSQLVHSPSKNFTLPLPPYTHNDNGVSSHQTSPVKTDSDESSSKPEKVKSRWRRNSELENNFTKCATNEDLNGNEKATESGAQNHTDQVCNTPIPEFEPIEENIFLFERKKCKTKKETKKMVCDCLLTREERARGLMGCGEDCLNRMLMIECSSKCSLEENCSNKRFQMKQYAKVEPFKTNRKGWGLRALENIPAYTFIMEYVGEVIDPFDFHKRVEKYAKQKKEHHYFMALKSDEIIDATVKGNITRFVNHSCDPNSETQKWTVNGELRIGFFTIRHISAGEEVTFDYQFQRYGKKAQKCYCEAANCRGYIGSRENANILTDGSKIPKKGSVKEDEDEEESEEEDEIPEDFMVTNEIELYAENGIRNRQQVILVSRLMLKTDKCDERIKIIDIIMSIVEIAYLRIFIDYHGLKIIWSWMVEAEDIELKARLLELLEILPIPNRTVLTESKVLSIIERWAHKDSLESQQYLNDVSEDANKEMKVENQETKTVEAKMDANEVKTEPSETKTNEDVKTDDSEAATSKPSEEVCDKAPEAESKQSTDDQPVDASKNDKLSTDLSKLSTKIVIKTKSKTTESEKPVQNQKSANLTIGYLAQKLLTHWKDLKEGYIIPRLKRQKRHDDEAEADRRTKEVEERRAKGLPVLSEKRSIDNKDYTIAGILGNKRRCLKQLTESEKMEKPQFVIGGQSSNPVSNSLLNNSLNNANLQNKLSKEDHRKLFEFTVAQNDYRETLKKYMEDLEIFRTLQFQNFQSMQVMQQPDSQAVAGFNEFQYSNETPNAFTDQYQEKPANSSLYVDTASEAMELAYIEENCKELIPKMDNPILTLCDRVITDQSLSAYAIDNVDYSEVNYSSDNCIESMEKKMFEELYPPTGIFFITKDGKTYFIALNDDSTTEINVKENVTEPLPLSFTKQCPENLLPYSWKYSTFNDQYYYYNKRKQITQWHPPQDCQMDNFDDQHMFDVACDQSQPSSTSSPNSHNFSVDKDKDSDISHEELSELKRKNQRRLQEQFRIKISQFIVKCLNPYLKSSCPKARIVSSSDFKHLARKLTHTVVAKELKQCKHLEDLACTESVKHKTKEYVKRYMSRFGPVYKSIEGDVG